MKYFATLLLAAVLLSGCSIFDNNGDEAPIQIQITNGNDVALTNITFSPNDESLNVGALGSLESSRFFSFDQAYSDIFITAESNGETFERTPVDIVNREELVPGRYSFHITLDRITLDQAEINSIDLRVLAIVEQLPGKD